MASASSALFSASAPILPLHGTFAAPSWSSPACPFDHHGFAVGARRRASAFAVKPDAVTELQRMIDELGSQFSNTVSQLESTSAVQRDLGVWIDNAWTANAENLETACNRLKGSLEQLGEMRATCDRAQHDGTQGLPYLFSVRAKDPDRFKRFSTGIRGCAAPDIAESLGKKTADGSAATSVGTARPKPSDCLCSRGTEDIGCQDARDVSDHELICSRIFNKSLPELEALEAFKTGGICRIEPTDAIATPVMAPSRMALVRKADPIGVAAVATSSMLPTLAVTFLSGTITAQKSRESALTVVSRMAASSAVAVGPQATATSAVAAASTGAAAVPVSEALKAATAAAAHVQAAVQSRRRVARSARFLWTTPC
eukprot:TRINITY_DN24036_c0_g1_i1.p1 TRINITY_DN24036_c0_g1~~TRINITY_DN24036_c0_g1_i1.p1  ORF type:complete len:401 (+),score=62.34 TRINITY_DN24036_c0_g1_i1:93-1205(+)